MSNPKYSLLENVHAALPRLENGEVFLTKESYSYYHYKCDGVNDVGWGCAYRTLQTICSMLRSKTGKDIQIPSIRNIQEILVKIGDKEKNYIGSRDWIGGVETCYVIDEIFDVPCILHHVTRDERLSSKKNEIIKYFKEQGGLIAMGGDQDAASKLVVGAHVSDEGELSLLIVDPHYHGVPKTAADLTERGYVRWQKEEDFVDQSFYNLCLPKIIK